MGSNGNIQLNFGRDGGRINHKKDGGVQRSAFGGDEQMESLFDKLDKDRNGILDQKELDDLLSYRKIYVKTH